MLLAAYDIDLDVHQPTSDSLPRGTTFRRRYTRGNPEGAPLPRFTPKGKLSRPSRSAISDIADTHEAGYDEKMAGVEVRKPVFGPFVAQVWEFLACRRALLKPL